MECKKCNISIKGGSDPTGFIFPPCKKCFNTETTILCRPCYQLFWKEFKKVQDNFILDFFKRDF